MICHQIRSIRFSMDGVNVNLKFYKEFSKLYKDENCHCLIDIGTLVFILCITVFEIGFKRQAGTSKMY